MTNAMAQGDMMTTTIKRLERQVDELKAKQCALMLFARHALDDMEYLLKNQKLDESGCQAIYAEAATDLSELIEILPKQYLAQVNADFLDELLSSISPDGGGGGTWAELKAWMSIYAKRHRQGKTLAQEQSQCSK